MEIFLFFLFLACSHRCFHVIFHVLQALGDDTWGVPRTCASQQVTASLIRSPDSLICFVLFVSLPLILEEDLRTIVSNDVVML